MDLTKSIYQNIQGAFHYNSGVNGPKVCISACVHGGETAGLDVIKSIYNSWVINKCIKRGSTIFLVANLEAYQYYMKTGDFLGSRYIDWNMNRIYPKANIHTSEYKRVGEIAPLLQSCDYHIDIHSTTQSPSSMAIYTDKSADQWADHLNVDDHYINLTKYQQGKPLISICEDAGGVGIGLETGLQTDNSAYKTGVENIENILYSLGMVDKDRNDKKFPKENLRLSVYGSVFVPSNCIFMPKENRCHKQVVQAGTILGYIDKQAIKVEKETYIIMPSSRIYPGEEYCFLGEVDL